MNLLRDRRILKKLTRIDTNEIHIETELDFYKFMYELQKKELDHLYLETIPGYQQKIIELGGEDIWNKKGGIND